MKTGKRHRPSTVMALFLDGNETRSLKRVICSCGIFGIAIGVDCGAAQAVSPRHLDQLYLKLVTFCTT